MSAAASPSRATLRGESTMEKRRILRGLAASLSIVLLAGPAWAAAAYKCVVPPTADYCNSGSCQFNVGMCSTNADCNVGSVSPKSKFSLGADGNMAIQLKGVVDGAGTPANGDYVVLLSLLTGEVGPFTQIAAKVTVTD